MPLHETALSSCPRIILPNVPVHLYVRPDPVEFERRAGGFAMVWMYGQSWFLDVSFLGASLRDIFQIHPVNLSVAVWVGFIALFGIAVDFQ